MRIEPRALDQLVVVLPEHAIVPVHLGKLKLDRRHLVLTLPQLGQLVVAQLDRRPSDAISRSSRWISPSSCFRIGLGAEPPPDCRRASASACSIIRFMLTTDGFCSVRRSRISLNCWRNCSTRWPAGLAACGCRIGPRQGRGRAGKLGLELVALPSAGLKLVLKLADVELRRLEPAVHDVLVAQLLGIGPAELRHLGLRVAQPLLIIGDLVIDEPPGPLDVAPAVADILLDEDLKQRLDDGMGQFGVGNPRTGY